MIRVMCSVPACSSAFTHFLVILVRLGIWGASFASLGLLTLPGQDSVLPALPGTKNVGEQNAPVEATMAQDTMLDATAINAARLQVAATLKGRREVSAAATATGTSETSSDDQAWQAREINLWERLDSVYAEQLRAVSAREDLAAKVADLQNRQAQRTTPGRALIDAPTFERLEQLYDQRDYFTNAKDWWDRDLSDAKDDLREEETTFSDQERDRRAIREKSNADPAQFLGALRLAEISARIGLESVRLRHHTLDTMRVQASLAEPNLQCVLPELAWVKEHLVPSPDQADQRAAQRRERAEELRVKVETARQEVNRTSVELTRHEAGPNAAGVVAELDPWRENRRLAGSRLSLLGRQLLRIEESQEVEEQRLAVLFETTEYETFKTWAAENTEQLRRLDSERRQVITDLMRSRRQSEALQIRLDAPPGDGETDLVAAFAREAAALQRWDLTAEQEVTELDGLRTVRRRLQEELDAHVAGFSWSGMWGGTGHAFSGVWNYELFTVGDQPVRLQTLLVVLVLVIGGLFLARRFSRFAGHLAVTRLKWSRGRSAAWQTLLFYAFTGFIILNIFGLFHLSLTQFTVISGALAVGLGFGSQNLINNFLSGIILLVERPIAEGDLIEVDGAQLWVENIGMRSTIVRSFDNTHVILPNSRLLDQPVTNWTLSDDVVRQKIAVGVAYGSDTRKVERVLQAVLADLEQVLTEPKPMILFDEFGDNALQFLVIFHTKIEDRFVALTEVRHAIVEAFVQDAIVIAFPQRDLHLDTSRPLEINLTPASAATTKGPDPKEADTHDEIARDDRPPQH